MEITDNESLFSDTLQDSKNSEIIEHSKCISHFFPFGQQFIQNLSICGRSIVQQDNCPWVDPCEKLIEGFLSGWLFILIPVYVGKTPEEGFIPQFLCHGQICCTVNSLRRPVEFRQDSPVVSLYRFSTPSSCFLKSFREEIPDISG